MNGSFIELIKDIKRDDSVQNVEKHYDLCVRSLNEMNRRRRAKEKEPIFTTLLSSRTKDKSITLLKLLYLQMYGRKIDPEHNFAVIEMLTSDKYFLKRRGHLFLHHSTARDDVAFLSINLFRKELYKENFPTASCSNNTTNVINSLANIGCSIMKENIGLLHNSARTYWISSAGGGQSNESSSRSHLPIGADTSHEQEKKKQFAHTNCITKEANVYNTALVLNTLSNICTPIMSSNLHNHVLHLLNNSQVYIKKKTIISLYKIVISNLEALPLFFDSVKKSFVSLYNNESTSYDQMGTEEMDRARRDNTALCCLIVNILAEVLSALEGRGHASNSGHTSHRVSQHSVSQHSVSQHNVNEANVSGHNMSGDNGAAVATYLKKFLSFIPFIYNILNERLTLIGNWKFIKIIKFVKKLIKYENRIYRKFLPLIVHVFFTNKAKSVIYECLSFVLVNYQKGCVIELDLERYASCQLGSFQSSVESAAQQGLHATAQRRGEGLCGEGTCGEPVDGRPPPDPMDRLLHLCFTHLANNFYSEDKNIVYVITKMYMSIFASPDVNKKFAEQNMLEELSSNVLRSFYEDVTIRKSLLRILYYLMNENNFESIAYNILTHLYHKSEGDFVGEYVDTILLYGQKKAHLMQNCNLYVFILFYMLCIKNHKKESEVIQEIQRVNSTQEGTTHITTNFLSAMYVVTYGGAIMRRDVAGREVRGRDVGGHAASQQGGPQRATQQKEETHNTELLHQMNTFLKEVKTLDAFARYDIVEYIMGTLNINGSDETQDKEEDPYKDINQVEVATFEYLLYFVYAYLEEAHNHIKEYKNEHFLKIFFFSLYLFFTHFSISSILWYVGKILFFFYKYEENRSMVLFYLSKFSGHVSYLLGRRHSVETLDCCVTLKMLFHLLRNEHHAEGEEDFSPSGDQPNRGILFYSCVTDYLQLDPSEDKFNLESPFKYNEAFFLPPEESRSGEYIPDAVQTPSSTNEMKLPLAEAKTVASTASARTPSDITASALTVDETPMPRADTHEELCAKGEATPHGDLLTWLTELNEEQSKWRQRDGKRTFHQISESAYLKLYFQMNQDERLLRLYVQLVGSPVHVKKLNVRTSLQVNKFQVEFKHEQDELEFVLLQDEKVTQHTTIGDDLTRKKDEPSGPSREANRPEEIAITTLTELTTVEEVTKSFLITVQFQVPSGSVKLAYSYLCNSILYEESSVDIPFVPLEPVALSVDELTNVKKRRGMNRTVTEEIKNLQEVHPSELIFSCCVFLAEYLHLFFFNMGKVFSNLQSGYAADTLRLIFCAARTSSREVPPDKTVFLINVHYKKMGQTGDPPTYRVEAKMKVLNDSEEECVRMLDYVQFYLTKLLTGRIKIKSPRIALTHG
ncbi:hypothetical protein AK88_01045 [Plasmodium fragile]|uniref:Clathrin/coatomer adaptor adaptin-like N-terminal domain-containing protein n=1 Tax=Plasmodium fragile TaxID=5857 RepID=A0A0D9QQN9_PLAFR|nr:uncharacterized protein AK88_01045 [Plasmodium fragile]KJP89379.1 hypothetical protein AK88_01045 [Plasmodium fragile]